jgi:hypothetical protein
MLTPRQPMRSATSILMMAKEDRLWMVTFALGAVCRPAFLQADQALRRTEQTMKICELKNHGSGEKGE